MKPLTFSTGVISIKVSFFSKRSKLEIYHNTPMACGDRAIPFSPCKIILVWRQDFINLAQRFESHRFL